MWIPKWYWESSLKRQEGLERRVKRLELILLREAENKIASLSDKEVGNRYAECFPIEEIIDQKKNTR